VVKLKLKVKKARLKNTVPNRVLRPSPAGEGKASRSGARVRYKGVESKWEVEAMVRHKW
jgi:hypothetical protein